MSLYTNAASVVVLVTKPQRPLHLTLGDVFTIDRSGTGTQAKLSKLLPEQPPVVTHAITEATLGATPVVLLERNDDLISLHDQIVDLLDMHGGQFNNPESAHEGFSLHSTMQRQGRLNIGDVVDIDSVAFIDMFPGGDWQQRKILSTFKLQDESF